MTARSARLALVAVVAAAFPACGGNGGSPCGPTKGVVTRIVDGDTIVLEGGEKIRYLLTDTTELSAGDCYSTEAMQFNSDLVLGKTVTLGYDEAGCEDMFGRLLAYVTTPEGREVNSLLVERGYACTLYVPPAGEARHEEFQVLEAKAKAAGYGMWSACEEVACD